MASYFDLGGGLLAGYKGLMEGYKADRELRSMDIQNKMAAQKAAQIGAYYGQPELLNEHGGRWVPVVTGYGAEASFPMDPGYQGSMQIPVQTYEGGPTPPPPSTQQLFMQNQRSPGFSPIVPYDPSGETMPGVLDPIYRDPESGTMTPGEDRRRMPAREPANVKTVAEPTKRQLENRDKAQDAVGMQIDKIKRELEALNKMQGVSPEDKLRQQQFSYEVMQRLYPGGVNAQRRVVDPYIAGKISDMQEQAMKLSTSDKNYRTALLNQLARIEAERGTPDVNKPAPQPPTGRDSSKSTQDPVRLEIRDLQQERKSVAKELADIRKSAGVPATMRGFDLNKLSPTLRAEYVDAYNRKQLIEQRLDQLRGLGGTTTQSPPPPVNSKFEQKIQQIMQKNGVSREKAEAYLREQIQKRKQ